MLFLLTTKRVAFVITSGISSLPTEPTETQTKEHATWVENDFLCKNYILNGLSDDLYDYYSANKTTKEIWDALQKKYDTKEAGTKKYATKEAGTKKICSRLLPKVSDD